MTTYRGIKGSGIQSITSDAAASAAAAGSWSSGGNLNTTRSGSYAFGTPTAMVYACGQPGPVTSNVEEYNGTAWTEVTNFPTARANGSATGILTAGLCIGGEPNTAEAFHYDGTSWTAGGNVNFDERYQNATGGTQTSAITVGSSASDRYVKTEEYDGSSWTAGGDFPANVYGAACAGASGTAIILFGGQYISPNSVATRTMFYDGSSWSDQSKDLNTGRAGATGSGAGTQSLAMMAGRAPTLGANTEIFDGSSWTEVGDLSTARGYNGSASNSAAATTDMVTAGGADNPSFTTYTNTTEEWAGGAITTFRQFNVGDIYYNADPSSGVLKYVGYGTGTWASGGNLNTERYGNTGAGTQTAAITAGGHDGTAVTVNVEKYDGSSWTETANLGTARLALGSFGTQTATIVMGGSPTSIDQQVVESWNGTSWTEIAEINTGRHSARGAGTQTSGIAFGGNKPPDANTGETETWDGSSWTEVGDFNTARRSHAGDGKSQTAAIAVGGWTTAAVAVVETWDGSSWTEAADLNTARRYFSVAGTPSYAIAMGGANPGGNVQANEQWNGSAWSEVADLSTTGSNFGGAGTSVAAIAIGGEDPRGTATEEWTVPTALETLASTNA